MQPHVFVLFRQLNKLKKKHIHGFPMSHVKLNFVYDFVDNILFLLEPEIIPLGIPKQKMANY